TEAPQGEELGLINPLSESSCSSDGVNIYGARARGAAPGTKSIWNSTFRVDGNPGKSFGKTSRKSRTVGTSSSYFSSDLSSVSFSVTYARKIGQPFLIYF
ncbi:hypothetical protein Tco_0334120, partial [Tanacetum coccineum]